MTQSGGGGGGGGGGDGGSGSGSNGNGSDVTFYDILGVPQTASAKDIRAAYKRLAKKHHPDRPGGNQAVFQRVAQAYRTLSSPERRQAYDDDLVNGRQRRQRRRGEGREWTTFATGDLDEVLRTFQRGFRGFAAAFSGDAAAAGGDNGSHERQPQWRRSSPFGEWTAEWGSGGSFGFGGQSRPSSTFVRHRRPRPHVRTVRREVVVSLEEAQTGGTVVDVTFRRRSFDFRDQPQPPRRSDDAGGDADIDADGTPCVTVNACSACGGSGHEGQFRVGNKVSGGSECVWASVISGCGFGRGVCRQSWF